MTYCLAIKLDTGLVFCSDSRTNAGADQVSTYSKMHRFSMFDDREIIILSAGNLATSQAVLSTLRRDIEEGAAFNLGSARYLSEIADYIGRLSVETQAKYGAGGPGSGFNASATFIVGGQIQEQKLRLYLVYPEGNHINASKQHPFLQIGETKYGKPLLERIIKPATEPETAMRCALVSMDSTMRSNATVGPPIELLYYPGNHARQAAQYHLFDDADPYFVKLSQQWEEKICQAFNELPRLEEVFQNSS
ncbi:MAG: peptidase [Pseudomonadales bacterium]|nr:peptidase [Gammaproteobacteria bacterium]NNL56152.1 peptidase [Pseudomonadales bacterium]